MNVFEFIFCNVFLGEHDTPRGWLTQNADEFVVKARSAE
jgi:hypothetical protein